MSDYSTVSVAQSKNLLDRKPASLNNYELLMRAVFVMFYWGKNQIFSKNIVVSTLKN